MSFFTPFAFIKQEAAAVPSGFDADAQAYINKVIAEGGTLTTPNQTAINDLYVSLKANSLYTALKYMYPFMGGTGNSHKICGIEPTTSGHILTYGGGLTGSAAHTSAGIDTIASGPGFASMGVNTNVLHSSVNNITLGTYISTATTNDQCFVFGKTGNSIGSSRYQMNIPFDTNNCYAGVGSAIFAIFNNTVAPVGRWYGSRTSSTSLTLFKNGSSVATQTGTNTGTLSADAPQFFDIDSSLFSTNTFSGVCGFIFGANGLSGAQVSTFDGILSTFLTAIGR